MTLRRLAFSIALSFVLGLTAHAAKGAVKAAKPQEPAPPKLEDLPWSLRDHYTITTADGGMFITYGGDNGDWSLDVKGIGTVLEKLTSSVTLGDGTVVDVSKLGIGDTTRMKVTAELGPGLKYQVTLKGPHGLEIVHSITYYDQHPFYTIRLEVANKGDKPVDIAKISPVVIPPGRFKNLGPETTQSTRRFFMMGPSPVLAAAGSPSCMLFHDPAKNVTLAFGSMSAGLAETAVNLQPSGGKWQGDVTSAFEPAVRLAPGGTLSSDPVWVSFMLRRPSDVDMYYAWGQAGVPMAKASETIPDGWVTVPDGGSLADLAQAAGDWKASGVEHVLVPVTWQGRPGSLEGATPNYPKDMKGVADGFRQLGFRPGVTLDPLPVVGGDSEWTAVSEDGQRWLNPASEAGMKYGMEQMGKVARWGFEFYAVAPSRIPDEVLKHFNLTRAQANALSYAMVARAVDGAVVVGASRATLGDSLGDWLLAAASTCRLREYSVVMGAVRFDGSKVSSLSDDLVTAMLFTGAPIELTGKPSSAVLGQVGRVFPKPHIWPRAIDAATPAPGLWQVQVHKDQGVSESVAIVSFPGAPAYDPDAIAPPTGEGLKTWKVNAADFLKMYRKPIPEANLISRLGIAAGGSGA